MNFFSWYQTNNKVVNISQNKTKGDFKNYKHVLFIFEIKP